MKREPGRPSSLRLTQEQFSRQARRYAESSLHRRGQSLETVVELAAPKQGQRVLDVGTGAGFTAFALASQAGPVMAIDLAAAMLTQARRLAAELDPKRKLQWGLAAAEKLPFADNSFDIVSSRFASHHFLDMSGAVGEFARVAKPGGRVIICDVVAPESPALVALMNELELRRDPTHVWDYPLSSWRGILARVGLEVKGIVQGKNRQLFSEWVHRAGTPPSVVQELIEMFASASEEARRAFDIRWEGAEIYFTWDNAVICAVKPKG